MEAVYKHLFSPRRAWKQTNVGLQQVSWVIQCIYYPYFWVTPKYLRLHEVLSRQMCEPHRLLRTKSPYPSHMPLYLLLWLAAEQRLMWVMAGIPGEAPKTLCLLFIIWNVCNFTTTLLHTHLWLYCLIISLFDHLTKVAYTLRGSWDDHNSLVESQM